MKEDKMLVMLTGGSGLVGKNFIERTVGADFDVVAPTRQELDLLDFPAVQAYMKKLQPTMVVHAAGLVGGIHANMKQPVRFLMENLDMGRNVVWAARQSGVMQLINLGSSCMYPRLAPNPLAEEALLTGELEPTNEGYALAKITVARLCEYITRENQDFKYKTLIPCNLYGRWDKFDPSHSHLIAAIIHKVHEAMKTGKDEVDIWGDGNSRREFLYAADLADCIVHALHHFDVMPSLMNVGPGIDCTINEYYKAVADIVGYKGRFVHDLTKPVGMKQKVVSVSKLNNWGWRSATSLENGLKATYDYYLGYVDGKDGGE